MSKKTFELKVIDIFNKIDELGNYSDYLWFYRLDKNSLIRYIRELYDIWSYRLQLTSTIKRNVVQEAIHLGILIYIIF